MGGGSFECLVLARFSDALPSKGAAGAACQLNRLALASSIEPPAFAATISSGCAGSLIVTRRTEGSGVSDE